MKHTDDELIPTRASLIHRLKNWQDSASWQDFFKVYWKLIYGVARKAGLSALTIDRVERGNPCRMDTKRKILLALGLKLSERRTVFLDLNEE